MNKRTASTPGHAGFGPASRQSLSFRILALPDGRLEPVPADLSNR
jgi:hypothetical protein